jgi:pantothenate kinase
MAPTRLRALDVLTRARGLAAGRRTLLGITGAPGAGKSTLAAQLAAALGSAVAVVAMDGFHLAQAELVRLGRADRKGAPDTFDDLGYAALLRRIRAAAEPVVYAPLFRRDLEEPIAGAVPVAASVPLVVTEGNYLLNWPHVREQLDAVWFLDLADEERRRRLTERRVRHGMGEEEAQRWTLGSDERNARFVIGMREQADAIVAADQASKSTVRLSDTGSA